MPGRFLLIIVALLVYHIHLFASFNNNSFSLQKSNSENQGGVLGFSNSESILTENSKNVSDSLILFNYEGMPLKAMQFKIRIENSGKLEFKSLSRGSAIPTTTFLFDYQLHKGEKKEDGSSFDIVSVILMGWGNNALLPGDAQHIVTIHYDVSEISNENVGTAIELFDVLGATVYPVQDAKISAGQEKQIQLVKVKEVEEQQIKLLQNYPNPFNPVTTISFVLKHKEHLKLSIFNLIGQELEILIDEFLTDGEYNVQFEASNLPSGIYIYQLLTPSSLYSKKMILVK